MVKRRTHMCHIALLAAAISSGGCLGRVSSTHHARTLPFHANEDTFDAWPAAPIAPPAPVQVSTAVRVGDVVGYYPLPAGLYVKAPPYNEAGGWAPIQIAPAPEKALALWFGKTIRPGAGSARTIDAVVTAFEWHFHDGLKSGGRIATVISVRGEDGRIVYSGERVTAVRVPFVDALFRVHVDAWLNDADFLNALGGGAR